MDKGYGTPLVTSAIAWVIGNFGNGSLEDGIIDHGSWGGVEYRTSGHQLMMDTRYGPMSHNVDPAETRTPVVRTLCKKYEAYIEIKAGIVIPVEFRISLQLDLVSTDLPTL